MQYQCFFPETVNACKHFSVICPFFTLVFDHSYLTNGTYLFWPLFQKADFHCPPQLLNTSESMILLRTTVSCKTCICVYMYTHTHTHIQLKRKKNKITQEPEDAAQMDECYSCIWLLHSKMINFYLWNQSNWLLDKETQYIKGRGK